MDTNIPACISDHDLEILAIIVRSESKNFKNYV